MITLILHFGGSDHWPDELEATYIGTLGNIPFRSKNVWLSHPDFTSNIDIWWMEYFPIQALKCLCCNKDINTSNPNSNIGTKKSFVVILKPKRC